MGSGAPNYVENAIWRLLSLQCPAMWLGFPIGAGHVFWVDGINGLDTNIGTRPDLPFQTIEHAITNAPCVANRNDYIMVLDCWQQEATWPITIDIPRIHIIGLPGSNNGYNGGYPTMQTTDDNPVFLLAPAGQYCEIAGFNLACAAASTSGAIELNNAVGSWIHDCMFGAEGAGGAAQDGIRFIAGNSYNTRIEDCTFYGTAGVGYLTRDGINFDFGSNIHTIVRNNIFNGLPTIAILLASNANGVVVKDNVIACDADTQGSAITLVPTTVDCFVVGNKALFGQLTGAMANNPYLDQAVAGRNHWMANYKGNVLIDPA